MKGGTLIRVLREIEKQTNKNRVRHIEKESGLKINYMYFYYMSVSFEPLYMLVYSQKFIHI